MHVIAPSSQPNKKSMKELNLMPQKDKNQYQMDINNMNKGKVNVGYEATTGNDTPDQFQNHEDVSTKQTRGKGNKD